MATNIDFIDDDIDVVILNEVDSLDVTAMGNAFIRYADSNYPTKEYTLTTDVVMNPNKDYYEIVDNQYVLTEDTEFISGKQYFEYDGVYKVKNNNKGYPHAFLGIYVGISEPIEEVESDVYNWVLRDTTTIDTLINLLQENKQDKLNAIQMQAVNSGVNYEKVVNYDTHVNDKNNPHNVTKAQLGLEKVVNTGDSSIPVEYGKEKFTTGGAYEMKQDIDGRISALTNRVNGKQDTLVNQQNIKSINGESILGSGNLVVKVDESQPIQNFNYDGTHTLKQVMDTKLDAANLQVCVGYEVIEEGE